MYEARAEPALSGPRSLVISYNVNSVAVTAGCVPISSLTNTITQPRFIAVPRAAFDASHPAFLPRLSRYQVVAGPSPYPELTRNDPAQWFNAWAYRGGCPPVPAVPDVAARQAGGSVRLEWPAVGLGVRYLVYLSTPGAPYTLVRTVGSPRTTLTGLTGGTTYQIRVVGSNLKQRTGPGAVTTIKVP